jgi:GxxExxY protein
MAELILKDEVYAIVGAAIEVRKELGAGFLEAVYQEAMELELSWREILLSRRRSCASITRDGASRRGTSPALCALELCSLS